MSNNKETKNTIEVEAPESLIEQSEEFHKQSIIKIIQEENFVK